MNISEKSKQTIDSCRFCWMCRHICPIGNATGQERDTARARAMVLSMVARGSVPLTEDIMDNLYECACCNACTNDCATGWDPVAVTKEVRLKAAMEDKTPDYIKKLVQNCLETGNAYGKTGLDEKLAAAIAKHEKKTPVLFYLGSDARYLAPSDAVNAIRLLEEAGVEFTMISEEPDSGAAMEYLVGAAGETTGMMKKAAEVMNEYDEVIIYEPFDAKVIIRQYKEWGIELKARPVLFPVYLAKLVKDGKLKVKKTEEKITCQDSYLLARELEETESVRDLICACGENTEMLLNRKATVLAGHLLMAQYLPDVIAKAAERRLEEAVATGTDTVVVSSVAEKISLAQAAAKDGMPKIETAEELLLAHK